MDYNNYDPNNNNQQPIQTPGQHPKKGMCVASLVLGIISVVFFCIWYISLPCAIIAIALGAVAGKSGKNGMATAGLIMGIIAIALLVIFWILALIGISALGDELNKYNFS